MKQATGYGKLLKNSHFEAFLWTQFLGAFNDNVYKIIVSLLAVKIAADSSESSRYLALAGAVFVIPYLLFSGYAGQLADRFSKTRVLQVAKFGEVAIMAAGIAALASSRIEMLLGVLFLLAVQATFFSPAKYAILPEVMGEAQLSRANGLLELTTFVAIVVGSSFGTFLFELWKGQPLWMGGTLLGIAALGALASLHIQKVAPAGSSEPFRWNPFGEVWQGLRELRKHRGMAISVFGISAFWFVGALFQMALILSGTEVLHITETQVGFLVAALALGIGIGSLAAGAISGDHIELGLVSAGSALMGVLALALGATHHYWTALPLLAGIGFAAGLFAVPLNAFLQAEAPPREKGRILTTNNFVNSLGVILASGTLWLLHDFFHWSPSAIFAALGAALLALAVYIIAALPDVAVRFLLRITLACTMRVRIKGATNIPRKGGVLLASNHISYADSFIAGSATQRIPRFLMWRPIFETPGVNLFSRILHAIPIGIDSPKSTVLALRQARAALEAGQVVALFPEGAISRTGEVETFQRGFERIVSGLPVPIVPMHIDGLWGHPLSLKNGRLFGSWQRVWWPVVTVRVGKPVYGPVSPSELRELVIGLAGQGSGGEGPGGEGGAGKGNHAHKMECVAS